MSAMQSVRYILRPMAGLLAVMLLAVAPSAGQDFIPAGYDDYQTMLDKLGIKQMRKGRNGRGQDTSAEATANPYQDTMPELMTFKDGTKVTSAKQWPRRRAEIVEDFEREVYGRVPKNVPRVKWEVTNTVEGESGGIATVTKTLVGRVDNSAFPKIKVAIQASFTVPKYAAGRVPIILQFSGFGGKFGGKFGNGGANSWTQQALNKGWGYGTIAPASIQPDNGRLREGIVGLVNKGEPRSPDDWGRAAGVGVGRELPHRLLRSQPGLGRRSGQGVHHGRFALRQGSSRRRRVRHAHCGRLRRVVRRGRRQAVPPRLRRIAGEPGRPRRVSLDGRQLPQVRRRRRALRQEGGRRLTRRSAHADRAVRPRPCFISYGIPAKGDPNWVDAHGSFMAAVLAGPAYRLLGKKDLGTPGAYLSDKMPPVNALIGGELAWRQHDGGHTNVPNFPAFYEWAGSYIATPGLTKKK